MGSQGRRGTLQLQNINAKARRLKVQSNSVGETKKDSNFRERETVGVSQKKQAAFKYTYRRTGDIPSFRTRQSFASDLWMRTGS